MSLKGRQDSNQKKLDDHSHTSLEEEMKVYVKIITICSTTTRTDYQPGKAGYSLVAPNHQGPQKPQITCETNTLW